MALATTIDADFDRKVFDYENEVRKNPKMLIPKLKAMLPKFTGKTYKEPGSNMNWRTNEGAPAVQEAIDFLQKQKSVASLDWSDALRKAARDHVNDMGPTGKTGHTGTDGSDPFTRMKRYTALKGQSGENIQYGVNDPEKAIEALIIDDGVPSRGHRTGIFNDAFKSVGIYTGDHKVYRVQTVLDYNGSDTEMKAVVNKAVDFGPAPAGSRGWSQRSSVKFVGGKYVKTTTRTYTMANGSKITKVITS